MIQILRGKASSSLFGGTTANWINPCGPEGAWEFNSHLASESPWPVAGTFSKLSIDVQTAASSGNSISFEVYKNNVATGITVTLTNPATSGSDLTNSVSVAAGDLIALRSVSTDSGSGGIVRWSLQFEGTTAAQHGYAAAFGSSHTQGNVSNGGGLNPFFPSLGWTGSFHSGVVANAMTWTSLYIKLSTALTGSNAWRFTLYKNSVAQDGTGGTPLARVSIGPGSSSGNVAFSLSLAAADTVYLYAELTAGSSSTFQLGYGIGATATTDYESTVNIRQGTFGVNTRYAASFGAQESVLSGEATHQWANYGTWVWRNLYIYPNSSIGGSGVTFTVRKGGVATVLSGNSGSGSNVVLIDSGDVATVAGDLLTIQGIGVGVQSRTYVFAYTMDTTPPQPPGGTETVTVTDAVALAANPAYLTVSDAVTVTDHASRAEHTTQTVNDTVTLTESATRVGDHRLTVIDTVTVRDASSMPVYLTAPVVTDRIGVTDAVMTRLSPLARSVSDSVTAVDGPHNLSLQGIGPPATPPPAGNLLDFWVVGIQ